MKKQTLLTIVLLCVLNGIFANEIYQIDSICTYQYLYEEGVFQDSALVGYELYEYNDQNLVEVNESYELDSSDMTIKLTTTSTYVYDAQQNLLTKTTLEQSESGVDSLSKIVNIYNSSNVLLETTKWTSTSGPELKIESKSFYVLDVNDKIIKSGEIEADEAGALETDTTYTIYIYDSENRLIKKEPEINMFEIYEAYTYTEDDLLDSMIIYFFGVPFAGFDLEYDYDNSLFKLNIFAADFETGDMTVTPIIAEVEYNVDLSTVGLPEDFVDSEDMPFTLNAVPKKAYYYDTIGVNGALAISQVDYCFPVYGESSTENPQSINNLNEEINIYPSIVTDNLNISSETTIESIEVYTADGHLLYKSNLPVKTQSISKSELRKGIVFVNLNAEGGLVTKKLIVE